MPKWAAGLHREMCCVLHSVGSYDWYELSHVNTDTRMAWGCCSLQKYGILKSFAAPLHALRSLLCSALGPSRGTFGLGLTKRELLDRPNFVHLILSWVRWHAFGSNGLAVCSFRTLPPPAAALSRATCLDT